MTATQSVTPSKAHLSVVQPDGRAGFGALRAELHARSADQDLMVLWSELKTPERKAVLASAGMEPRDALRSIEQMSQHDRDAIRAAIGRMSRYAQQLGSRLGTERHAHPSRDLAANARRALDAGRMREALHWLDLIERGAK
ncbi:hypothetical protein [Salinicola socius]|uniref:Uncharacterized protein n=1 Tax=Salinicola socius TaxID=404433 RepID=A0A1Q8SPE9_9GAMM|nr:hypothetical protein [Salinicola socius]OLO03307.1 hypothetical protein BTW07_14580 [Salinicola socius]